VRQWGVPPTGRLDHKLLNDASRPAHLCDEDIFRPRLILRWLSLNLRLLGPKRKTTDTLPSVVGPNAKGDDRLSGFVGG